MLCKHCKSAPAIVHCVECTQLSGTEPVQLCQSCSDLIHKENAFSHSTVLLNDQITQIRNDSKEKLQQYTRCASHMESLLKEMEQATVDMKNEQKRNERVVRSTVVQIQGLLKKMAVDLLKQSDAIISGKIREIEESRQLMQFELSVNRQRSGDLQKAVDKDDDSFNCAAVSRQLDVVSSHMSAMLNMLSSADVPPIEFNSFVDFSAVVADINNLKLQCIPEICDLHLMAPPVSIGDEYPVLISSALSKNGVVYVLPEISPDTELVLSRLSQRIRLELIHDAPWRNTYRETDTEPHECDAVYVRYSADNTWYRGFVEEVKSGRFTVRLSDYGNSVVVGVDMLVPAKSDLFKDVAHQAIGCCLFPSLESASNLPMEARWMFSDMTKNAAVSCKFINKLVDKAGHSVWHADLRLESPQDVCGFVSVNDEINKKLKGSGMKDTIVCRDIRYKDDDSAISRYIEMPSATVPAATAENHHSSEPPLTPVTSAAEQLSATLPSMALSANHVLDNSSVASSVSAASHANDNVTTVSSQFDLPRIPPGMFSVPPPSVPLSDMPVSLLSHISPELFSVPPPPLPNPLCDSSSFDIAHMSAGISGPSNASSFGACDMPIINSSSGLMTSSSSGFTTAAATFECDAGLKYAMSMATSTDGKVLTQNGLSSVGTLPVEDVMSTSHVKLQCSDAVHTTVVTPSVSGYPEMDVVHPLSGSDISCPHPLPSAHVTSMADSSFSSVVTATGGFDTLFLPPLSTLSSDADVHLTNAEAPESCQSVPLSMNSMASVSSMCGTQPSISDFSAPVDASLSLSRSPAQLSITASNLQVDAGLVNLNRRPITKQQPNAYDACLLTYENCSVKPRSSEYGTPVRAGLFPPPDLENVALDRSKLPPINYQPSYFTQDQGDISTRLPSVYMQSPAMIRGPLPVPLIQMMTPPPPSVPRLESLPPELQAFLRFQSSRSPPAMLNPAECFPMMIGPRYTLPAENLTSTNCSWEPANQVPPYPIPSTISRGFFRSGDDPHLAGCGPGSNMGWHPSEDGELERNGMEVSMPNDRGDLEPPSDIVRMYDVNLSYCPPFAGCSPPGHIAIDVGARNQNFQQFPNWHYAPNAYMPPDPNQETPPLVKPEDGGSEEAPQEADDVFHPCWELYNVRPSAAGAIVMPVSASASPHQEQQPSDVSQETSATSGGHPYDDNMAGSNGQDTSTRAESACPSEELLKPKESIMTDLDLNKVLGVSTTPGESVLRGTVVGSLEPDGCFVMKLEQDKEQQKEMDSMQMALNTLGKLSPHLASEQVKVGSTVLAKTPRGDGHFRALVVNVTERKATVRQLDYGRTLVVPIDSIQELTEKLIQVPRQALRCCIATRSKHRFSESDIHLFNTRTKGQVIIANVLRLRDTGTDLVRDVTVEDKDGVLINSLFCDQDEYDLSTSDPYSSTSYDAAPQGTDSTQLLSGDKSDSANICERGNAVDFNDDEWVETNDMTVTSQHQQSFKCDRVDQERPSSAKSWNCYNCGEAGHVRAHCPLLSNENASDRDHSMSGKLSGCYNCGETGHARAHCPLLCNKNTNDRDQSSSAKGSTCCCFNCGEMGHIKMYCPLLCNESVECYNCGQKGHYQSHCKVKKLRGSLTESHPHNTDIRGDSRKCHKCSQIGHIASHCPRNRSMSEERLDAGEHHGDYRNKKAEKKRQKYKH